VAVTVDMIATGTDIKPLECVVFMRSVQSRGLFEQMKGRGVRVIPDADFQAVTPDAKQKTHFVIVDCVGVMEAQKSDPPLDRERGISFPKLLELIRAGNRDEDMLATLAARLDRMDRKLTPAQRKHIEGVSGGVSVRDLVAGILDRIDPDAEDQRARQIYGLAPQAEPSDEQVQGRPGGAARRGRRAHRLRPQALRGPAGGAQRARGAMDTLTLDQVTRSGPRADLALDYDADKALVSEFETFCKEHRDTLDALSVLYSRPLRAAPHAPAADGPAGRHPAPAAPVDERGAVGRL
jgi:type I restriction enzyme R subunit